MIDKIEYKSECKHTKVKLQLVQDQFVYLLQEFKRNVSAETYQNALKRLDEIVITEVEV